MPMWRGSMTFSATRKIPNIDPAVPLDAPGAPQRLDGYLELRNITFGYSRLEKPLDRWFQPQSETGPARGGRRRLRAAASPPSRSS